MPAQDPDEPFDLYTREGTPLGRTKPRREVHRDGDWHRSVHIWVWGTIDGAPHLVFQRRSLEKDTWPGRLDVAVTGHARAGETIEATLREAEEEIGLAVRAADVVRLGLRRRAERRPGVHDNELQEIFVRARAVDLLSLRPSPAEVSALVALPFASAERVLSGGERAPALRLEAGASVNEEVSGADFVPATDGYYRRATASLERVLSGEAPEAWTIG